MSTLCKSIKISVEDFFRLNCIIEIGLAFAFIFSSYVHYDGGVGKLDNLVDI